MILILPKTPANEVNGRRSPYMSLYSDNKAAVIDQRPVGLPKESSYSSIINSRILDSIEFSYKRNYLELSNNEAFFVGALVHLHLDGNRSRFKIQMVGGLPTDMEFDFEQIEQQAHFKKIRTPRQPQFKLFYDEYPGAIIDVTYTPESETPIYLHIKFGKVGQIENGQWVLADTPDKFEDQALGWDDALGVSSIMRRYNVPNLFGDILDASGFGPLDSSLAYLYNIQLNIHEVEMDLVKLEITNMRVTVELPYKVTGFFTEILEPGMRFPTFEIPSITQKVIDGGNQAIEPYRKEIQFFIKNGSEILTNQELQSKLMGLLNQMFENKTGGQP